MNHQPPGLLVVYPVATKTLQRVYLHKDELLICICMCGLCRVNVCVFYHLSSHLNSHPSMPAKTLPVCQPQMTGLAWAIKYNRSRLMLCINSPAFFDITLMASFSIQSRDTYALINNSYINNKCVRLYLYTTKDPLYCYSYREKRYNFFRLPSVQY